MANLVTDVAVINYVAQQCYTKTDIDNMLVGMKVFKGILADSTLLPTTGNKDGDVYIVGDVTTNDPKEEWIWIDALNNGAGAWELYGTASSSVNYSDFATLSGNNTFTGDNTFTGSSTFTSITLGNDTLVIVNTI